MDQRLDDIVNTLIYLTPQKKSPSRYELISFAKMRVYLFQELQSFRTTDKKQLMQINLSKLFPNLYKLQKQSFYNFISTPKYRYEAVEETRRDNISHFSCRMLYSQNPNYQNDFVNFQKTILEIRLRKFMEHSRDIIMSLMKRLLSFLLNIYDDDFNVPQNEWNNSQFRNKIINGTAFESNKSSISYIHYAKLPIQIAEAGIHKRRSFINKGYVYANIDIMIEILLWAYTDYLKEKLLKTQKDVATIIQSDAENQITSFIFKTLDTMNQASLQEAELQSGQKLSLKNIEAMWPKYFPPCMMYLTQALKMKSHLKHDGRRQLWLFFKGCGMPSIQNQQFFRRHMAHKVSDSDMKAHIYNIQHAYGQVGKRQPQNPKICRNIITGPAPKKDQYHGCPFSHWQKDTLGEFLRKNYKINEDQLNGILMQKQKNRYQIACGRLFEANDLNHKLGNIPEDILAMLGKSPHAYFQAGMEIAQRSQKNKEKQKKNKMDIQF